MKTSIFPIGIALLTAALIQGCASTPMVVTTPVGPAPAGEPRISEGALIVYTATEDHAVGDGPRYYPHSGYSIQLEDGKLFKYVPNHTGSMDEQPKVVLLPVGNYKVSAQAEGFGRVTVPVVIAPRKVTTLHLDGDQQPKLIAADDSSLVKLPNGKIIGWRAGEVRGK